MSQEKSLADVLQNRCSSKKFPADLVTFTEEIIDRKLHFFAQCAQLTLWRFEYFPAPLRSTARFRTINLYFFELLGYFSPLTTTRELNENCLNLGFFVVHISRIWTEYGICSTNLRILSECRKIQASKATNSDTSYAVATSKYRNFFRHLHLNILIYNCDTLHDLAPFLKT